MAVYAYIRVSSKEQNTDRQLLALEPYGIPRKHIFCDRKSGKNFDRPAWRRLVKKLRKGDLLLVKSIDRLGRNYKEILHEWQRISKEIGADIKVLDMDLLDTRKKAGGLTGTLIADLVLQLLAYVAQTERDYIRQRQAEGIAAARARGQRLGRAKIDLPSDYREIFLQYGQGDFSSREGAARLGVSQATFLRRYREFAAKEKGRDSKQ